MAPDEKVWVVDDPRLVSTGECARAIGVHRRTLQKWVQEGFLEPDGRTAGGHMRWDVERVRRDLLHGLPRASRSE